MLKKLGIIGVGALLAVLSVSGCSQGSKEEYDNAGANLKQAAHNTGQAIKSDAKVAGSEMKKAADNAGKDLSSDAVSAKVNAALIADKTVKTNDLKVETKDKLVILTGEVGGADQKTLATQIAKDKAGPGYTIDNKMTVAPPKG